MGRSSGLYPFLKDLRKRQLPAMLDDASEWDALHGIS